jgi:predicted DsbA family dithiol-disulfide isomerase
MYRPLHGWESRKLLETNLAARRCLHALLMHFGNDTPWTGVVVSIEGGLRAGAVRKNMITDIKIDFVSDVSCPWCVIGLKSLERAVEKLASEIAVHWHFQPFELNPTMGPQGEDVIAHVAKKYGAAAVDIKRNGLAIQARGAELGFAFDMGKRRRIYNTFDAHRLLHWAQSLGAGKQRVLKNALFAAYFTEGRNPSDHSVLLEVAGSVGLDVERASAILSSSEFANEVRARENFYASRGITAVPSVIINDTHLIQGGQPQEVFEEALRRFARETQVS